MSKLPVRGGGIPVPSSAQSKVAVPASKRPRLAETTEKKAGTLKTSASTPTLAGVDAAEDMGKPGSKLFSVGVSRTAKSATKPPARGTAVSTSRPPVKRTASSTNVSSRGTTPGTTRQNTVSSRKADATPGTKPVANKPKRAAWDTKGKLEDLSEMYANLQDQIDHLQQSKENQAQHFTVTRNEEMSSIQKQHSDEIGSLQASMNTTRRQLQQEIDDATAEKERFRKENAGLYIERDGLSDKNDALQAELRLSKKEQAALRLSERELTLDLEAAVECDKKNKDTIAKLTEELAQASNEISELKAKAMQHETERRRLHNIIQELKGNIRVYCRVRPALNKTESTASIFTYPDMDEKKVTLTKPTALNESCLNETMRKTEKLEFGFDHIFTDTSTQAQVFEEISQLVQSALDGYNVCIFAYGQTGSGKTYTMQGAERLTEDTQGMIPRSIQQIFTSTSHLIEKGWQYEMVATFLEIYNETIRDLLAEPGAEQKHEIKTASGEVQVTNMSSVTVSSPAQIEHLFERATKNRAVAETSCNSRSSRSHSVFQLKISGRNSITSEECVGTLNLVDLAGSERLKESKSAGDRLTETKSINSSLSALGNVIMALSAKKSHIPYRDSKLTYLLQNSLGGNSKTLMFVNVSPSEDSFNETVNSMRFATKVNNCTIGTAKKSNK